jgi:hypothetical protein
MIDARAISREDRTGAHARPAFALALEHARRYGSRWIELRVAFDQASWCIEHNWDDRVVAYDDLVRALACYADGPSLPAVSGARILLERLEVEERT